MKYIHKPTIHQKFIIKVAYSNAFNLGNKYWGFLGDANLTPLCLGQSLLLPYHLAVVFHRMFASGNTGI